MFGLEKCKEEDFYEFELSNGKYSPRSFDGYLLVLLMAIFAFGGMEYCYLSALEIENKQLINVILTAFVVVSVILYKLTGIKNKKYAYKFQKIMIIILGIYWFIFSFIIYPAPLILGIAENHEIIIKSVIYAVIIGLIYFIVVFMRLIYLIRKGQMRKGCGGLYERLIGNKISYTVGCSIPIVVISNKLARNVTISMNNSGNKVGSLIMMLVLGFAINIITVTFVPEIIILAYCKFRFKSYNIEPIEAFKKKNRRKKRR
ncbi:MAG: hypothetical protein ACI398_07010 [Clostridium sp.]